MIGEVAMRRSAAIVMAGLVLGLVQVVPRPPAALAEPNLPAVPRYAVGVGGPAMEELGEYFQHAILSESAEIIGSVLATGLERVEYTVNSPSTTKGCGITRPRTDQAAVDALLNDRALTSPCIHYARLSSEPEFLPTPQGSELTYYPYARDGLSYLVPPGSYFTTTATVADLRAVFTCQRPSQTPVLPGYGSQLRKQWLSMLGLSDSASLTTTYPCLRDTVNGKPISDNDTLGMDASWILPFSVSQYAMQTTGDSAGPSNAGVLWTRMGTVLGLQGGNGAGPLKVNTTDYQEQVSWVSTNWDLPADSSLARLQQVFRCQTSSIAGTPVTPALPRAGSPERAAWLSMLEITETEISLGDYPCIQTLNRLNDSLGLAPAYIMPYSIAKYIDQATGASTDLRGSGKLRRNSRGPATSDGAWRDGNPITLNTSYGTALTHRVYHAVATQPAYDQTLVNQLFRGAGSLICAEADKLSSFGLTALPKDECGGGDLLVSTRSVPSRGDSTARTVFLVHGFQLDGTANCRSSFDGVMAAMRGWGWTGSLKTVGYYKGDVGCTVQVASGHTWTSINELGRQLAWHIYEHHSIYGRAVDVLAHSMGGLVVRAAISGVQHHWSGFPPYLYIEDVATLGTPHTGTSLGTLCAIGTLGFNRQCREMIPGSSFLTALDGYPESDMGTDWTLLCSTSDTTVDINSACQGMDVSVTYPIPGNPKARIQLRGHIVNYSTDHQISHSGLLAETSGVWRYHVHQDHPYFNTEFPGGGISWWDEAPGPVRYAYEALRSQKVW
jgi:hypothetical protein